MISSQTWERGTFLDNTTGNQRTGQLSDFAILFCIYNFINFELHYQVFLCVQFLIFFSHFKFVFQIFFISKFPVCIFQSFFDSLHVPVFNSIFAFINLYLLLGVYHFAFGWCGHCSQRNIDVGTKRRTDTRTNKFSKIRGLAQNYRKPFIIFI